MKWFTYALLIIFIGALTYQFLIDRKGGLQITPKNLITGEKMRAPGFEGGNWVNSEPLALSSLMEEKKVVLVDFWTYSCVNCQRTLPYLKQWWSKYKDKGLVIVGVHSPEFEFEKKEENVLSAMTKYGVTWPVVQDNDFKIWRSYSNHYWPAKYLVVPPGVITYTHFGEGDYEETEMMIRTELGKLGYDLSGMGVVEENEERVGGGISPETYLGYSRGRFGNGDQIEPDKLKVYEIKDGLMSNLAYLGGEWLVVEEYAKSGKEASLVYKFSGGEVNLVMRSEDKGRKVKVFLNGKEIKVVEVMEADLYNLYKGESIKGELKLVFEEGIEAYAFTFGQ